MTYLFTPILMKKKYMTEVQRNHYLVAGDKSPERPVKCQKFIPKVMLKISFAIPWWNRDSQIFG